MPFDPRSIFEPEVLTDLIELRAEEDVVYNIEALAPIQGTTASTVEIQIANGTRSRLGQFRAVNAMTPISAPPGFSFGRTRINIPILAEKERIDEETMTLLNSADTELARRAADIIVDNGVRLREQNINLSKWMVFRALQDLLTITYPSGGGIDVVYGLANADGGMGATHLATAAVLWSNPAADIVGDVDAWKERLALDGGIREVDMWISTPVWRNIEKNTKLMQLAGSVDEPQTPTEAQVAQFLRVRSINVYDESFVDAAGVTQYFMPQNKVILVANPAGARNRSVRLMDGPVAQFNNATQRIQVRNNPGMVAEIWASPDPPEEQIRIQTARMPVLVRQRVFCATVQ